MHEVTGPELTEALKKEGTILVDFYADWCGPCKTMARELEKYSEAEDAVPVVSLDIDGAENSDLVINLGIQNIPTLILFRDGEELTRQVGSIPADRLTKLIQTKV